MSDLAAWLENFGLGKYREVFAENEIVFDVLPELTEEHFKEMGLPLGPRLQLLKAIALLGEEKPDSTEVTPPLGATDEAMSTFPQVERRQLTVMFVDLVGSTELSTRLDPEDMRELMLAYQNTVAGEIGRFAGHIAKFMGDGVLVYFGWPRAYEDAAERAVRAALSITEAVTRIHSPVEASLATRVGIASGIVVVGDLIGEGAAQEETVVGETPNLAARLQALATAGAVVISDSTRQLLRDVFELQSLGTQALKGFAEPIPAYAVLQERLAESRYQAQHAGVLSPMVGRQHELAQVLERWQQASQGEGQMILLSGDAGIGKSRLLHAANDTFEQQPHHRIYYQCSPYHNDSALYPVIQQLTRAANFTSDENTEAKLDKLEKLLGKTFADNKSHAPLIAALLGLNSETRYGKLNLTPQQQRMQTLRILIDYLTALAEQQPVLLVVEDAHWIDPTTLELIDLSLDTISQSRVLLVMTARLGFEHRFGGHPIVTRLLLYRLGRESSRRIIERLSGAKTLPDKLLDEIIRKTDGVPLFVEELTKTVLESGMLRETEDAFVVDGPLRSLDIPNSLHDSLMARLDRLASVKEVAQLAACIGREFSYELIAATASQSDGELQAALAQLTDAELIFARGAPPESSYTFKHALIQDVAYQSLLRSKRQQLHDCIAKALEGNFVHQVATQPELLAHHYTEAGRIPEAIEYWRRAGELALSRSAYLEAHKHMQTARNALETLPANPARDTLELNILPSLSAAVQATAGLGSTEMEKLSLKLVELARKQNDKAVLSRALSGLARCLVSCGQVRNALAVSQESLTLAEGLGEPEMLANAQRSTAAAHYYLGEFIEAVQYYRVSLSLSDHERVPAETPILPLSQVNVFLSRSLWYLGYPDQALQTALQFQRDAGQQYSENAWFQAWVYSGTTRVYLYCGDLEAMLRDAEALRQLCLRYGMTPRRGQAEVMVGIATALLGKPETGIQLMEQGIRLWRSNETTAHLPDYLAYLARAYGSTSDFKRGLSILEEAIDQVEATDERHHEAEIRRIKGELLLQRNGPTDLADAELCFRLSLDVARRQQAKSWELRSATSLARLWRDQSKRREAHDLLTPIYDWFTEGFDTADLKDAKALLDELA